ncbi:GntR family transcriptional regulator [Actinoplanes regularis]|uniref:GntR family transcriptional regulator n=1 Tax=Actinoplanes regularis TaxID=52697 RepID=A0A239C6P3_9ACTN|nr:GntR family transcriptional regulator [Actinoplanes regularis]GIE92305.1 GntR family transcriptional regulator [Actinoplanes regularis]SNS15897.1 GntR family transcriptional regulator [Actinoplanes regularis]
MAINVPPPKYAVVVNAVQQRIEDGTYAPGTAIPSETQLTAEFDTSRPTVVRALGILQQDGWIESQQGKGRYVKGRPSPSAHQSADRALELLDRGENADVTLLRVGAVMVPNRAAAALDLDSDTPVILRRRLVDSDIGPVELSEVYVPVELSAGTDIGRKVALPDGVLRHLAERKKIIFDHAAERISARLPTAEEADLLKITDRDAVLTLLVTVFDRTGAPQFAVDAVVPANRHEIESSFPLP